jgi:hypothetical protein
MPARRLAIHVATITAALVVPSIVFGGVAGSATASVLPTGQQRTTAGDGDLVLVSSLLGRNEVPVQGGPAVGDKDGHAIAMMRLQGDRLTYKLTWKKIGSPTAGHLHLGAVGANGPLKVELFAGERPARAKSAGGTVQVTDPETLAALRDNPTGFYVNVHNKEFPGGAVRGRLHALSRPLRAHGTVFVRPVVSGAQIYQCTEQPDGTYAYTQLGVKAVLRGGIRHSFVRPAEGPPQWIAADRSAVTGRVLARFPYGPGNIPELDLQATQSGRPRGLLSRTDEILRLNTVGGTAPAGACDPREKPTVRVPYQADYLFTG